MLITKENIDIWYSAYEKQRAKSEKYAKSRGGTTRRLPKLTKAEFKMDLISEAAENPKLSGKQIAERMAKQETFVQTMRQARVHAEAHARVFGGEFTPELVMKYRIGAKDDVFKYQDARRAELKALGESATDIKLAISQEFYGSD